MKTMFLAILLSTLLSPLAFAGKADECMKLWKLEKELGCPESSAEKTTETAPDRHFLIESDFGPSKCVVKSGIAAEKKDLEKECKTWINERKVDLSDRYLTGTCNSKCTPCEGNTTLQECSTHGEVHYRVEKKQ